MFLPVVGDGAVAAAVQETVGELCFVAFAVVCFECCVVGVAFFVAVHWLTADIAGCAVDVVVEELVAACLVVVAVSALGGASRHVCSFPCVVPWFSPGMKNPSWRCRLGAHTRGTGVIIHGCVTLFNRCWLWGFLAGEVEFGG